MANQNLSTRLNAGAAVVVIPGTSDGLVSKNGVPGNTTGSAIAAGYVGEKQEVSMGGSGPYGLTSTADTWTDASAGGTIAITAGIWLVGYSVTAAVTNSTSSPGHLGGCVGLYDGATIVSGSIGLIWPYVAGSNQAFHMLSHTVVMNVTSTKTLSLRTRCIYANTTATIAISGTNITSSLTDPDGNGRIWAVRIA